MLWGSTIYEGVSKSFWTGRLERELQMIALSATGCSCIAILWVSQVSFAAIKLYVASRVFIVVCVFRYRLSPETFGYTLVHHYERINTGCGLQLVALPACNFLKLYLPSFPILGHFCYRSVPLLLSVKFYYAFQEPYPIFTGTTIYSL
jgi:hypothetical protein